MARSLLFSVQTGFDNGFFADETMLPAMERSPFQTTGWLRAWARAFRPADRDCHLATVRDGATGALLMALPLVREERGSLAMLTLPDRGVTDYQGPIVAPGFDLNDYPTIWRELVRHLPPADVLLIEKSPGRIGSVANPVTGLGAVRASRFARHVLPLDAPFAELRATRFDGTSMRSLTRKRGKLERKGALRFELVSGRDHAAAFDQVLAWRAARFADVNSADKAGIERAFYQELLAEVGLARLGLLTLDGNVIAGAFGVEAGGTFAMLCLAYDTAFKNYSPGLLITETLIEWYCRRGFTAFDFTIGNEGYKFDFGVVEEPLTEYCEALSLRGVSYVATYRAKHLARRALAVARGFGGEAPRSAA